VLVVDVDALQTIDFLDFVDQVLLQLLFAEHGQDVVRVARAVHQGLAGLDLLAFLDLDVHAAGQRVLLHLAVFALDANLALAFADFAVFHRTVDLRHDGRFTRLARFEQLHHARQTAGDVLGLGGFARDLGQHVAGVNFFPVVNHQVSVRRHQVLLGFRARSTSALGTHDDGRLPLFVRRVRYHELRHTGDFVHTLLHGQTVDQVFEVHHAADFGQDREGVRIPFQQDLVALHRSAVFHQHARAVIRRVAFLSRPLSSTTAMMPVRFMAISSPILLRTVWMPI